MRLSGKAALITGGSSGIGLATAQRFIAEGAKVMISSRAGERLRQAAEALGPTAVAIAADAANPADLARLMAEVKAVAGRLDVLVVNAAVANAPPIAEVTPADYAALMDINCRGAVFTVVEALPLLAEGASVILTGSVGGRKGQPGDALYAGSKGFIRAFGRTLGTDPALLARRIRVNVVSPGPINTPLIAEAITDPEIRAYVEEIVPMGRLGRVEEVAAAMVFLASDELSFTSGAEITVDGGFAHV